MHSKSKLYLLCPPPDAAVALVVFGVTELVVLLVHVSVELELGGGEEPAEAADQARNAGRVRGDLRPLPLGLRLGVPLVEETELLRLQGGPVQARQLGEARLGGGETLDGEADVRIPGHHLV